MSDFSVPAWSTSGVLGATLVFRLVNALCVNTFFNPDEYWQAVEVAHRIAFGYGHLTWEWTERIRGFTHPLVFAAVYALLRVTHLDYPILVVCHSLSFFLLPCFSLSFTHMPQTRGTQVLAPRMVQAVFAAVADTYLYRLVCRYDTRVARATLCCTAFCWFLFYSSVRTLSNTMEAQLSLVALYYWLGARAPQPPATEARDRVLAAALSAAAFVVRPTAAIFLAPVVVLHLVWTFRRPAGGSKGAPWTAPRVARVLGVQVALPAGAVLGAATAVDSVLYGRATLVPLNFFLDNIVHSVAGFYGTHAWHWYFTAGLPTMLGPFVVLLAVGVASARARAALPPVLGALALWPVAVHSLLPHKEFRFVLTSLYLLMPYCGAGLVALSRGAGAHASCGRRVAAAARRVLVAGLLAGQVVLAHFFCFVYQRGPIAVMDTLTQMARMPAAERAAHGYGAVEAVDFLCECHATPFYAYVHTRPGLTAPPFPMRFLDCTPDFAHNLSTANVEDRVFQRNPAKFAYDRYINAVRGARNTPLPSHIVSFSKYDAALRPFYQLVGYWPCATFPHDLSTNVTLFCRRPAPSGDSDTVEEGDDDNEDGDTEALDPDLDMLVQLATGRQDHP